MGLRLSVGRGALECLQSLSSDGQARTSARSLGAKWVGEMFPPPPHHPLLLEGPSPVCLYSSSPTPSHAPRTHAAGGGLGGWRTRPGTPASFPGPLGQGNAGCSSPDPLIPEGPSPSTSPLPPPPHHDPRTHTAGGGPRRQRTRPGSPAGFPGPAWAGETAAFPP